MYAGNTGTPSLLNYLPTGGDTSIMALIYMDVDTGNPGMIVGSGTPFLNTITGTPQIYPYIPAPTNLATQIPLAAVRLSSGTNSIDWSNLYDVRQWTHGINTGSAGGGGTFAGVDQIGIYALDDGAAVGTGTTVNFGNNLSVVRTGTTLFVDAVAGGGGGGGMGFIGKDEGVFQGTGTILNVVGNDVVLSFSGSTLTFLHTNPAFPQDNIGIYGQNKGVSLGTGTTLNVNGTRLTLTQSGTVLELSNSPDPQELIGVYGLSNGAPLGTGTWLDFGNNLTATLSGTVLRIDATAGGGSFSGVDQIGIYGLSGTTALGTGTSISFGNYLLASITGTTLYLSAHVGTGSTQLAGGGHNHAGNDGGTQIPTAGIQDDAVTFPKMQNFGGQTVLGNPNVGVDEPSLITFTATARSLCDDTSVADMRTTLLISDATLTITDITTNNASTGTHGFLKKLSNVSTEFMNGVGNWATPPGVSDPAFGGGNDGDVVIASGTTTLTRDMYYDDLTIEAGATLVTAGYIVKVKGTLTIAATGIISADGTAGTAGGVGTGAGGAGGTGVYTTGTSLPSGGSGADGQGTTAVGTANGATRTAVASVFIQAYANILMRAGGGGSGGSGHGTLVAYVPATAPNCGPIGGDGGAGTGAGNTTRRGGGGGGGGGVILVYAFVINNGGTISATGGVGGDGVTSSDASGNGGGGGGGTIVIFYRTTTGSGLGTQTVTGGAAGTGGNGGSAGTAGTSVAYVI
jgi:hypothetical protein